MSEPLPDHSDLYRSRKRPAALREAFTSGEIPVTVYGLGKMGLPLAAVFADVTGNTVGVDVDPEVVDRLNRGDATVEGEPGLSSLVSEVVEDGAFRATTEGEDAAQRGTVHVVIVPTLLTDDEPDLSMLQEAVRTIGRGLSPGDLVVIESTVPPRTTVERVLPLLSAVSGLDPGTFGAAACPERTVSGQALADIRGTHPKVVGGVDEDSTRAAALIYDEITDNEVIETTDAATAEAVKVFEGVYRDVNIALANQLALFSRGMDIDVTDAIEVANTQPFCDIHSPGPGVGGHCIPVYPYFLSGSFGADSSLLEAAREMNDGMPLQTVAMVESIIEAHGRQLADSRILLLGLTYKAGIDELRNAPAVPIARNLGARGAEVVGCDPVLSDWSDLEDVQQVDLAGVGDVDPDGVVLVTPHEGILDLPFGEFGAPILDGRDALEAEAVDAPVYRIGGRWP